MAGRDRLREIVEEQAADAINELGRLRDAADRPGQASQEYVDEHARHAHEAIDRAAEACRSLVREGE